MTALVIAFPLDRRRVEVIQAAKRLDLLHGQPADKWWKETCKAMADDLRSVGVGDEDVRRQVLAFQDAVQVELQRLALYAGEVRK
ncbi:DUF6074 family protein [Hoeflea ulvae]|uniref:DUF6074 family protein n=1 Tax=Hoeflea ulvae TaxID=2983764 RepID=A0ABT3YFD9_9HYPH|nr:DUF6074 family protein [Hoeflea ulvae]MCY0094606.1 DUF6074 family protein [Hoeflea ulvae]